MFRYSTQYYHSEHFFVLWNSCVCFCRVFFVHYVYSMKMGLGGGRGRKRYHVIRGWTHLIGFFWPNLNHILKPDLTWCKWPVAVTNLSTWPRQQQLVAHTTAQRIPSFVWLLITTEFFHQNTSLFIFTDFRSTYVSGKVVRSKDQGFRYKKRIIGQLPSSSEEKRKKLMSALWWCGPAGSQSL